MGNVQKLNEENFIMKSSSGATKIQLHTVSIDRGLHYEKAINMYQQAIEEDDYFKDDIGFYVSSSVRFSSIYSNGLIVNNLKLFFLLTDISSSKDYFLSNTGSS